VLLATRKYKGDVLVAIHMAMAIFLKILQHKS